MQIGSATSDLHTFCLSIDKAMGKIADKMTRIERFTLEFPKRNEALSEHLALCDFPVPLGDPSLRSIEK